MTTLMWFRRDLRLTDHPALLAAHAEASAEGGGVLGVFVCDPRLLRRPQARSARLLASVMDLHRRTGGALVIRVGTPQEVIPALAEEVGATRVHVSAETTPYGRARDDRVRAALAARARHLTATGSPYAIGPGILHTRAGTPFAVFTPFHRAWLDHGAPAPAGPAPEVTWVDGLPSDPLPKGPGTDKTTYDDASAAPDDTTAAERDEPSLSGREAGENAALRHWRNWLESGLAGYDTDRDRPDLDSTSRASIPLKYGELHPRTLLADLAQVGAAHTPAGRRFVAELCWREFYADVLYHRPDSAWQDLRPIGGGPGDNSHLPGCDEELVAAWRAGRTGFPMVDAGMRQLLAEGFMHNRLRMLTASFLVKDLHAPWTLGARHFLDHLLDGDVSSNNQGWQWVAGTGTDAAPYFRVFNPVTQGVRFDPDGDYVRRWIPELRHLPGRAVHEPWKAPDGYHHGYPQRIVDHAEERARTLAWYQEARA
ncbi:MAG: cryptochrome/photolyase family protein [Actinomycetales bacterium]